MLVMGLAAVMGFRSRDWIRGWAMPDRSKCVLADSSIKERLYYTIKRSLEAIFKNTYKL